jgi:hypothetical protein
MSRTPRADRRGATAGAGVEADEVAAASISRARSCRLGFKVNAALNVVRANER